MRCKGAGFGGRNERTSSSPVHRRYQGASPGKTFNLGGPDRNACQCEEGKSFSRQEDTYIFPHLLNFAYFISCICFHRIQRSVKTETNTTDLLPSFKKITLCEKPASVTTSETSG